MFTLEKRIAVERAIIAETARRAFKAGYSVDIFTGDTLPENLRAYDNEGDIPELLEDATCVDMSEMVVNGKDGKKIGTVVFIQGNGGYDVIADHTDNPEIGAIIVEADEESGEILPE